MRKLIAMLSCVLMLAACGGGVSTNPPVSSTISGTASQGAPITGPVTLKDSKGITKTGLIDTTTGAYSIVVDGMTAPFILKAGNYYSVASSATTININPFTDLCAKTAAGSSSVDTVFSDPTIQLSIVATKLPAIIADLRTSLDALYPSSVPLTKRDFMNGSLTIDQGVDIVLKNISISSTSGNMTINYNLQVLVSVTVVNNMVSVVPNSTTITTMANDILPHIVPSTADSMKISAGYYHSMALKTDGTAWAWGNNNDGQLGNGTTTFSATPLQVKGLSNVIDICTGDNTSIALKNDKTVWIWGRDQRKASYSTWVVPSISLPQQLSGISQVAAVSVGNSHGVALKDDGTVWWWGRYGTGRIAATPTQLSGLSGVKAITSEFALKTDGTLCSLDFSSTPTQTNILTGIKSLLQTGTSLEGGYNQYAVMTDGSIWKLKSPTTQVTILTGIMAISTSINSTFGGTLTYPIVALKSDGTVWNWGESNGTALKILGLTNITAISIGLDHVLALKADGTVLAWGENNMGQLGDGTTTDRATPVSLIEFALN